MNPNGNIKHGLHGSLTYKRWKSMRQRAAKTVGPYANIECCSRWESFETFLSDMGECKPSQTLDRIKNNVDYEPGNCQWATKVQQNTNRSTTVMLTHNGITKSVAEWARTLGVSANTLRMRLHLGWETERVLTIPIKARTAS